MGSSLESAFEAARPRLFALAYRLLGSAAEAEDAVQDAFLRWNAADRDAVVTPAAWLTKIVTNLCLNRLTSARVRRESYVGPWLPEPVMTGGFAVLGPLETVEQRESVSIALLVLLERLTPPERGAFVLREAFGYGHGEIAEVLGVSESSSQQLCHRARRRLAENRQDGTPGERGRVRRRPPVSRAEGHRIAERFLDAARGGDLAGLEKFLADEVVAWSDGGGRATAALRPIVGARRVASYFTGWANRDLVVAVIEVNGQPAVYGMAGGRLLGVAVLDLDGDRVTAVHTVANPDKLAFMITQMM